jgi:MFS transporter, FHS family, glucose/mannose:H+ symporter
MEQADQTARRIIAATHIGFVLTGVVTTMIGPVLPALAAKWGLDDAQAGYLFTAQFAGSMTGAAASSRVIERLGYLRVLLTGYLLMAAGVAALGAGSWAGGIFSVYLFGAGLGITIPTTNLLISELNPARREATLNIINFAWGIGAVASPPVLGLLTRGGHTAVSLAGLSVMLLAVALWLLRFRNIDITGKKDFKRAETIPPPPAWRSPFVALMGALIFIYVGAENAVGGWLASYALRFEDSMGQLWAIVPSVFWGALLVGRAAAPVFLRRVAGDKMVLAGLALATLGIALIVATISKAGLLLGTFMAGAGFASVFPNSFAVLAEMFGARASKVAGVIFVLAGFGGATLPWLVGFVSARSGSLRVGLLVALICGLVMIALQMVIIVALNRRRATTDEYG